MAHFKRPFLSFAIALICPLFSWAIHWSLTPIFAQTVFFFFYPAIFLVSWAFGFWRGLVTTLASVLVIELSGIGSSMSGDASSSQILARYLGFILMGMMVSLLNERSHRSARSLTASEDRLKFALEAGGMNLWEWNPQTDLVWRSENHDKLFGLSVNLPLFRTSDFMTYIHPEDRDKVAQAIRAAMDHNKPYELEYRVIWPNGEIHWILTKGHVHRDESGKALSMAGASFDITQRKTLELQVAAARDEAESLIRAKSQFVANMSHEMRTPLGIILGFTDLALEQSPAGSEQQNFLQRVKRSGEILYNLIGDVLDLSRIEAQRLLIEKVDFDLVDLVNELVQDFMPQFQAKQIVLRKQIATGLPRRILTDPTRLRQILNNLLSNALKFTDRGEVLVDVRQIPTSTKGVERIEFRITDTGIGLSAAQQGKLFQPFTQADASTTRKYGGTGLGLSLSREMSRVLGGDLWIEKSEPGVGSTFVLLLNVGIAETSLWSPSPNAEAQQQSKKDLEEISILVVDDSADNRFLVERMLRASGAQVRTAENGLDGVNKALDSHVDLILMDLQMPLMDGYEATRQLRSREFQKPIIALTAHALNEEKLRALEIGFDDYLSKPVSRPDLVKRIRQAVEVRS